MNIGVFAKPHRTDFSDRLQQFVSWLQSRDCHVLVDSEVVLNYGLIGVPHTPKSQIAPAADLIVVFGGDGTMLSVVRQLAGSRIPILGVNLGTLGFLTGIRIDELFVALQRILEDRDYAIDRRDLLKVVVQQGEDREAFHALNDVVINKGALARIISMDAFINDHYISEFLADGLIISTPTGSTAYSLSAGGPILFPSLEALIVTPICPHTLTNRPFVVPADSLIRVVLKEGEDVMLTIDGQIGVELNPSDQIVCTRSEHKVDLIHMSDKGFFDVLREKLKWGAR